MASSRGGWNSAPEEAAGGWDHFYPLDDFLVNPDDEVAQPDGVEEPPVPVQNEQNLGKCRIGKLYFTVFNGYDLL